MRGTRIAVRPWFHTTRIVAAACPESLHIVANAATHGWERTNVGVLDTHVLLMVVIRVEEDPHAVEDLDVAERRPELVVLLGVP